MNAGVPSTLPACVCGRLRRRTGLPSTRRVCSGVGARPWPASRAEDLGQPPVHDLDLAEGADHDVGRLQVAVDDAVGVGVADRLADLLEHRQQPAAVVRRVRPLLRGARRGCGP